jgi:hypothetical protein
MNEQTHTSRVLELTRKAVITSADAARAAQETCRHLCKTVRSLVLTTLLIGQAGVGMVQNTYDAFSTIKN